MDGSRTTRTKPAPARIGQIAIPVSDVERATRFYDEVLGLSHLFSAPPGLSFFRCGEVRLMLAAPESEDEEPLPGPLLYYAVNDVVADHDALRDGGAEVVAEPHVVHRDEGTELWMAFYLDSEGNRFATMAEVRTGEGVAG